MKEAPKFADIGTKEEVIKKSSKTYEINNELPDPSKRLSKYDHDIEKRIDEITAKIDNLEKKIQKLTLKEAMIDSIINRTNTELQNLNENEFTRRGQKQSVLIKQLEAHSILQDTLIKWETMLQNYHKILIDIENNKLSNFYKIMQLSKEEKETDKELSEVLEELNKQLLNKPSEDSVSEGFSSLISDVEKELKENNF